MITTETGTSGAPPFPGGIGVSHLRVYDTEAPDGLRGGTPHVHSVCTEAYVVIAGSGAVQTLTGQGFRETQLKAGSFVWFTPGTIHRLVNGDGALEILVIMEAAGLPEAGDMVITFPDHVLADPAAYHERAALPAGEETTTGPDRVAMLRRDLAVDGFDEMRAAIEGGDTAALTRFHHRAATLLRPRTDGWREVVGRGPARSLAGVEARLDAIVAGDPRELGLAAVHALAPPGPTRRMGCCGTLGTYLPG